jgi:carbamoyltransferase
VTPQWIAGISHGRHDAACALLRDGKLVAYVEQERLSRVKRAINDSPAAALRWCLETQGLTLEDLTCVTLGSDHRTLARWLGPGDEAESVLALDDEARLFRADVFADGPRPEVVRYPHHLAHAASAFWPSGFGEAAVLVVDAMGEDSSGAAGFASRDSIEILRTFRVDDSLGFFFETACEYVGFDRTDGGKLMGLASYGKANQRIPLAAEDGAPRWGEIPESSRTGRAMIHARSEALLRYFETECFPFVRGLREEVMAYANFAASIQSALNETIVEVATRLRAETGARYLVLAGGVALSCAANGRVAQEAGFEKIFVQPAAHDAGVALGSALLAARDRANGTFEPSPMPHAYWGPAATGDEILAELETRSLPFERLDNAELPARVARVLAEGGVVAWHQGRAEVGPRALGARSLLGDPRSRRTLVRLNRIKERELWRPLAPSVLEDDYDTYFVGQPNPFMLVAAEVRPEVRSSIPAVVHVDGSSRPQVVSDRDAPLYAELLRAFGRIAGVPLVVNTSLNRKEEPICTTPADTLEMFLTRPSIDVLAIGSFLVGRR